MGVGRRVSAHGRIESVEVLRVRLERVEREAASRQRQLERYAADLREVFKQRARPRAGAAGVLHGDRPGAVERGRGARRLHRQARRPRQRLRPRARPPPGLDVVGRPQLEFGFLLHDVGKVAVPDAILFKTGPLTEEEYALIALHPVIGRRDPARRGLPRRRHARRPPPPRALGRHRLSRPPRAARTIPLAARVFAVADTLDALTTDRPYRPAVGWDVARDDIRNAAGTQFDPGVVAAYETVADPVFVALAGACADVARTILIVDDDPMHPQPDRDDARGRLGLPADRGRHGQEALETARRTRARRSSSSTSRCRTSTASRPAAACARTRRRRTRRS